jgi:hypothetical protein
LHIQRDAPDPRDDDGADEPTRDANERAPAWTTQIDLVLPSLGALGAQVRVRGSHVTLALTLGSERGSGLATLHRERLASALQAAGLTLTELTLQRPASP